MRPAPFDYHAATSLADAMRASRAGATPLAGGRSLLAAMELRQARPTELVDLGGLESLQAVAVSADRFRIGAGATHRSVAAHSALAERVPSLSKAVSLIGDVQVRNRGTVGGNLCFADPRANLPPVLPPRGGAPSVAPGLAPREVLGPRTRP